MAGSRRDAWMSAIAQMAMTHDRQALGAWFALPASVAAVALLLSGCATRPTAAAVRPIVKCSVVQAAAGASPVHASLVVEPADGVRPLTRLIDRAQESIEVEAYILSDRRIVRALERASVQGVRVTVLLERHPFGLAGQPEAVANVLRAAGVWTRWAPARYALTHAKFAVLDGRTAIIGTGNLSRSAFTGNRDIFAVSSERALVRAADRIFRDDWDDLPVRSPGPLVLSPINARAELAGLIASAEKSLVIYGEELVDPPTACALVRARYRGVQVRVLLPSLSGLAAWLRQRRVQVRTLAKPYIHAKVMVADGREAFIGSENMSAQSLDRNREVGIMVRGLPARRLLKLFQSDWKRAG